MTFTDLQTAYDRQLPESNDCVIDINNFTCEQLSDIAEKLADSVADGKALEWRHKNEIHVVSRYKVELEMSYDNEGIAKLITMVFEEIDAKEFLTEKFNLKAQDMIYNNILSFEELPLGHKWEDYV